MTDEIPINMTAVDRIARLVAGLALLSLYFFGPRTDWALLGLLPIATAAIGYCPIYALFGRELDGDAIHRSRNWYRRR